MKKFVSLVLCLIMAFSIAVPAFAEEPAEEVIPVETPASVTGSTVVMKHTDVVVRALPGTDQRKIGTLYVGDSVTVTNWAYQQIGSYWWVQIEWGSGYGYVRSDLIP